MIIRILFCKVKIKNYLLINQMINNSKIKKKIKIRINNLNNKNKNQKAFFKNNN